MSHPLASPAQALTNAFYSLRELEFFQPNAKFPAERETVRRLVARARDLETSEFHAFSQQLILAVAAHCENAAHREEALHRAFDGIDEVLGIDYQETRLMMPANLSDERLYEGGGVGVQTSYASIMKVLGRLNLAEQAHLIDLGSGFGRVGLATGLWRDDLRFSGYELVGHRVHAANASAGRAGLADRVRFFEQDLSAADFCFPAADAYYLYDPFTAATYHRVFARLSEMGRARKTTVIAKDGARESFRRGMDTGAWFPPEVLDEGTILLFRSR